MRNCVIVKKPNNFMEWYCFYYFSVISMKDQYGIDNGHKTDEVWLIYNSSSYMLLLYVTYIFCWTIQSSVLQLQKVICLPVPTQLSILFYDNQNSLWVSIPPTLYPDFCIGFRYCWTWYCPEYIWNMCIQQSIKPRQFCGIYVTYSNNI
jgi:hypothetical protein